MNIILLNATNLLEVSIVMLGLFSEELSEIDFLDRKSRNLGSKIFTIGIIKIISKQQKGDSTKWNTVLKNRERDKVHMYCIKLQKESRSHRGDKSGHQQ